MDHPPTRTLPDLFDKIAARDPARAFVVGRECPIGTGTVQKERDAAGA